MTFLAGQVWPSINSSNSGAEVIYKQVAVVTSQVVYDDAFITLSWNAADKQFQYLLKSTAPIAWTQPSFVVHRLAGSTATTNGTSTLTSSSGRLTTLALDAVRFFTRTGTIDSSYNMTNYGGFWKSYIGPSVPTAGFPTYILDAFVMDVNKISMSITKVL